MSERLRELKRLFPESEIITDAGDMEYFYEDETLIIRTPDRSRESKEALANLKANGLSGVWRSRTDIKK